MENWEKRFDEQFPAFYGVGAPFPIFKETPNRNWIKQFISSELESAKQEEIKISAIKNQSAELYYISAIKELCGAKVLDKVLEKVIELSKKDKKHRECLIASLHQNSNKQGGK